MAQTREPTLDIRSSSGILGGSSLEHREMAQKDPQKDGNRLVARNKRARFEYELGDTYEAGLVLIGSEARSLRDRAADLSDAWVEIDANLEAWLKGMRIPEMKHAAYGHREQRPRKLLLHDYEILQLKAAIEREGMTIVATKLYFKNHRVKIEIAVARGKKKHDKRQTIKERDAAREARDAIRRAKGN
jgi:SsrA-binding protein